MCFIAAPDAERLQISLPPRRKNMLSNREKLGMDQIFVVWTSKSGLNQPRVVWTTDGSYYFFVVWTTLLVQTRKKWSKPRKSGPSLVFPGC